MNGSFSKADEPVRKPRMVVGVSGASGIVFGERLLPILHECGWETYLVTTRASHIVLMDEQKKSLRQLAETADFTYKSDDIGALISSGSFPTDGMIIAPCTANTLAKIASGVSDNLLTRAADVTLKERRKLVMLVRETPLHLGHLRNMAAVTEMGGIIMPPLIQNYLKPKSLTEAIDHLLWRVLMLWNIEAPDAQWRGLGK